jgi:hypothetical protein
MKKSERIAELEAIVRQLVDERFDASKVREKLLSEVQMVRCETQSVRGELAVSRMAYEGLKAEVRRLTAERDLLLAQKGHGTPEPIRWVPGLPWPNTWISSCSPGGEA